MIAICFVDVHSVLQVPMDWLEVWEYDDGYNVCHNNLSFNIVKSIFDDEKQYKAFREP